MVLRIIHDMRNNGKRRSKKCRAQNEDLLGPGPLPLSTKTFFFLYDQSSVCSHGYFYWIQRYDSHIMWFPWVPVMFSSVQFSHYTFLISPTQFLDNCSGFVCLFFNLFFFSLCSLYFSASENSTERYLWGQRIFFHLLRPSKISSISVTVFFDL